VPRTEPPRAAAHRREVSGCGYEHTATAPLKLSEGRDTSLAHPSALQSTKLRIAQEFNRPRLRLGQSRLTIPNLAPQSPSQRRSAPTAIHHRSGTSFGFLPESMFTFTGIPTHVILG
jgi:hypothetical protein